MVEQAKVREVRARDWRPAVRCWVRSMSIARWSRLTNSTGPMQESYDRMVLGRRPWNRPGLDRRSALDPQPRHDHSLRSTGRMS